MRKNFPVTEVETKLHPDQYLISKTDLKGRITYANPAFVQTSGFSREELLGKAHNIVRHPDMPPACFQDLWDTLRAGKPWLGIVKNRRKDGGYYWTQALVSPIEENGVVTGYASVRVCPSEEDIQRADAFYKAVNDGTVKGYTIKEGRICPIGWRHWLQMAKQPFNRSLRSSMFRLSVLGGAITACITYFAFTGGVPKAHTLPILGGLVVGFAAYLAYGWRIAQRVITPIENASLIAQQIAAGNLLQEIQAYDPRRDSETNQLYFCLELMRKSLTGIASDTYRGISGSMQAAQALHADNQRLNERTAHQADALQQTAASMEELTITVGQNADNAVQATQLAQASLQTAQRGATAVGELAATMQGIHDSAQQITAIVNLIEGIAFQTNILALNAAVESARAGEAGRGFAVVAGEVRSLAQRSSSAAGDIKKLIDDSVQRMLEGVKKADHAADTMHEIEASVNRVSDIIREISNASEEQAQGLQQINRAMNEMDSFTQDNASLAQQLGHTVERLTNQSTELEEAIRVLEAKRRTDTPPPKLHRTAVLQSAPERVKRLVS